MLTLDLSPEPRWLELAPGLRLQLRPLTTALMVATQRDPALQALPEVRWAEPLAEAVPRLLRRDLARAATEAGQPVQVWGAALPAGLSAALRLRIDIERLEADLAAGRVRLAAIWVVSLVYGGYLFGNVPIIKDNLGIILIVGIAAVLGPLVLAAVLKVLRRRRVA